MTPRILVMAGEPSGDLHGSRVVRSLARRIPGVTLDAVGGPLMAGAGARIRRGIDDLAAMGLVEVVHGIPAHLRLLRELKREFNARTWDLLITIDYPGFHLRVAEAARRAGIPVLGYVAPQLWAWGPSRADRWSRAVDQLAVILPFEADFFRSRGMAATYVGHPLLDGDAPPGRSEARRGLGIGEAERVLAVFPGSRTGEVERIWPQFRDAALELIHRGNVDRAVVAATAAGRYPGAESSFIFIDDPASALASADVALAKSGTTTLQAALAGVPMVVGYRTNRLTHAIARRLVTVRWVSLVNLVAGREVVPELVQGDLSVDRLVDGIALLIPDDSPERMGQLAGFAEVRQLLGTPGASDRVAELAAAMLGLRE